MLSVVFGVLEVPKTTPYGVWRGKDGGDWHEERLKPDCRSTTIAPQLETDLSIVETFGRT